MIDGVLLMQVVEERHVRAEVFIKSKGLSRAFFERNVYSFFHSAEGKKILYFICIQHEENLSSLFLIKAILYFYTPLNFYISFVYSMNKNLLSFSSYR